MSEDKIEAELDRFASTHRQHLACILNWCESPIEKLFLASMACEWELATVGAADFMDLRDEVVNCSKRGLLVGESGIGGATRYVVPQYELETPGGPCRLDLAVFARDYSNPWVPGELRSWLMFAVELDGHDFHERTKEQARRDRSRDRRVQSLGWRVFRYTGSEVYADSVDCVWQLDEAIVKAED